MRLPRAIACANDQTALGVMYALPQHGIDVPGDVAVTGFDDIPVARHLQPPLTTVRQPIQEFGAVAFDVLYSMITVSARRDRQRAARRAGGRRDSCGCTRAGPLRLRRTAPVVPAMMHSCAGSASTCDRVGRGHAELLPPAPDAGQPGAGRCMSAMRAARSRPTSVEALEAQFGVERQRQHCGPSTCTTGVNLLHGDLGISTSRLGAGDH